MTYKAYKQMIREMAALDKQMIEDRAALDAYDCAAFSREVATLSGGGDPDMAVTFVAAVPSTPAAVLTEVAYDGYVAF